jgi:hypothetical protein
MLYPASRNFLRYVLWADAISCLACGALQLVLGDPLSQFFSLPAGLLSDTGVFLLAYGAAVAALAIPARVPGAIVWLLIVGNVGWGVAAVGILVAGDVHPTLLGKAYIVVQALTVLILAELQYSAVRRSKSDRLVSAE